MVEPHSSNFRVITTNCLGVRIFRKFTVKCLYRVSSLFITSIGLAIARRLGQDGAKVMVSSRKQANVDRTLEELRSENLTVEGMVCHVGKSEDRKNLVKEVSN